MSNLVLDMRSAEGNLERLPALMQELIAARPDVITVATSSVATVAQRATSTIPIVMLAVTDPVGSGVVDSLARPGGNITGISHMSLDVTAKALEILREIMPNLQRIGISGASSSRCSAERRRGRRRRGRGRPVGVYRIGIYLSLNPVIGPELPTSVTITSTWMPGFCNRSKASSWFAASSTR
jgi:putative ABC transport system substrate-binding protein